LAILGGATLILTPNSVFFATLALQPAKLILTQMDYFRRFEPLLNELNAHPELVGIQVINCAGIRAPDSFPSLRKVIQHISWAPVVVSLDWK
jgi:hypothetical protein